MSTETEYEILMRERDEQAKKMQALDMKLREIRLKKADDVLAEVRNKVAEYEFSVDQVFPNLKFKSTKTEAKVKKSPAPKVIKYKNEDGLTWSGGRGPKPKWVAEILEKGGDIEQFRVKDEIPFLNLDA